MCRNRSIALKTSFSVVMISVILAAPQLDDLVITFKETTPVVRASLNFTLVRATSPPVSVTITIDDKNGSQINRTTINRSRFQINDSYYHLPSFGDWPSDGGVTPGLDHVFHFTAEWNGNVRSNTVTMTRKIPPHPVTNVTVERSLYTYTIRFNTISGGYYDRLDMETFFEVRDEDPDITVEQIRDLEIIRNGSIVVNGTIDRALRRVNLTLYSSQTPCLNSVVTDVQPRYKADSSTQIVNFEISAFKTNQGYRAKVAVEIAVGFNQGFERKDRFFVSIGTRNVNTGSALIYLQKCCEFYKTYTLKEEHSLLGGLQNDSILIPGFEYPISHVIFGSHFRRMDGETTKLIVPPLNVESIEYIEANTSIRVGINRTGLVEKLNVTMKVKRGNGTFHTIFETTELIPENVTSFEVPLENVGNGTHYVDVLTSSKDVHSAARETFTFVHLKRTIISAMVSITDSSYNPETNNIEITFQVDSTKSNVEEGDKFEIQFCNVNSLTNCQTKLVDIELRRTTVTPRGVGTHKVYIRTSVSNRSQLRIRSEDIAAYTMVIVVPRKPRDIRASALRPPYENTALLSWERPLSQYHGIVVECLAGCNWHDSVLVIPKKDSNTSHVLQALTAGATISVKVWSMFNESNITQHRSEEVELKIRTWPSPFQRLDVTSQELSDEPDRRQFNGLLHSRSPVVAGYYKIIIEMYRVIVNLDEHSTKLLKSKTFYDLSSVRNSTDTSLIQLTIKMNENIHGAQYWMIATGYGARDDLVTPALNASIFVAPKAPIELKLRSLADNPKIILSWKYPQESLQDSALIVICYSDSPENCLDEIELLGIPGEVAPRVYNSPKLPDPGNYLIFVKARSGNVESPLSVPINLTVGMPCTHPDGLSGKLLDDSDRNRHYFPNEKDYTLACDEGFKLRRTKLSDSGSSAAQRDIRNTLWSCKGGEWVQRSECQAIVDVWATNVVGIGTAGIILCLICMAVSYRKYRSNKRCSTGKKQGYFDQSATLPRGYL